MILVFVNTDLSADQDKIRGFYLCEYGYKKLSGKRKFSKDNFLPFLIAVLLWCNIVVVLWYKLNKESFSFDIFIGFAPAITSLF